MGMKELSTEAQHWDDFEGRAAGRGLIAWLWIATANWQ
jgi:hypothetical protein